MSRMPNVENESANTFIRKKKNKRLSIVNSLADEKVFSTHTGLKMSGEFKGVRLNYNRAHV